MLSITQAGIIHLLSRIAGILQGDDTALGQEGNELEEDFAGQDGVAEGDMAANDVDPLEKISPPEGDRPVVSVSKIEKQTAYQKQGKQLLAF